MKPLDLTQLSFTDLIALKKETIHQCSEWAGLSEQKYQEYKLKVNTVTKEIFDRIASIPTKP